MLLAFYEKIADQRHGGASKLKADATRDGRAETHARWFWRRSVLEEDGVTLPKSADAVLARPRPGRTPAGTLPSQTASSST